MSDTTKNSDLLEEFKRYVAERDKQSMAKCPSCGYCPHCGHRPVQVAPYWYQTSPYWQVPWYFTTTTTTGGNVTSGGTNAAL